MSREKLTIENVFKKPKYLNIISLVVQYSHDQKKKLELKHLRIALCKDSGFSELEEKEYMRFFDKDQKITKKVIEFYEACVKNNEITNKEFNTMVSHAKKNEIDLLRERGDLTEEDKFNKTSGLSNACGNLRELGLIDPNYVITDRGRTEFFRFMAHHMIDNIVSDAKMMDVYRYVLAKMG
jgi:hypothetical protein